MSDSLEMPAFESELADAIQGDLLAAPLQRAMYATDASVYQIMPRVVVCPGVKQM